MFRSLRVKPPGSEFPLQFSTPTKVACTHAPGACHSNKSYTSCTISRA